MPLNSWILNEVLTYFNNSFNQALKTDFCWYLVFFHHMSAMRPLVFHVQDGVAQEYIYYPPEVSSMKYCCLGVFRKEYSRLLTK